MQQRSLQVFRPLPFASFQCNNLSSLHKAEQAPQSGDKQFPCSMMFTADEPHTTGDEHFAAGTHQSPLTTHYSLFTTLFLILQYVLPETYHYKQFAAILPQPDRCR